MGTSGEISLLYLSSGTLTERPSVCDCEASLSDFRDALGTPDSSLAKSCTSFTYCAFAVLGETPRKSRHAFLKRCSLAARCGYDHDDLVGRSSTYHLALAAKSKIEGLLELQSPSFACLYKAYSRNFYIE